MLLVIISCCLMLSSVASICIILPFAFLCHCMLPYVLSRVKGWGIRPEWSLTMKTKSCCLCWHMLPQVASCYLMLMLTHFYLIYFMCTHVVSHCPHLSHIASCCLTLFHVFSCYLMSPNLYHVASYCQALLQLQPQLNLVESWDGFIYDFPNHSTPPIPTPLLPPIYRKK